MKGHEPLILMRKKGYKPPIVFMSDEGADLRWEFKEFMPDIDIGDEKPFLADFRFLIGMVVSIDCKTKERARGFFETAKRAKPSAVSAGYWQNPKNSLYMFWCNNFEYIEEDGNVKSDTRRHRL